jgi:hypothetical protein
VLSLSRCGLAVVALCLVATVAMTSEQRIVLDDAHAMHAGNDSASPYRMTAAKVLIIDASEYELKPPDGVGPPNAIHIKIAPAGYYRVPLDSSGVHRIDGSAQPLEASKALVDFKSGQTVVFAIVNDNFDSMTDDELQFKVIWAGMIRVD